MGFLGLPSLIHSLWINRHLIGQLTKREVVGRYRGSALGLLWSFFNPVFMLSIYTVVFGSIFRMRWNQGSGDNSEFVAILFTGLIIHGLFSETVSRATRLIVNSANLVKKVIFPLEILPVTIIGAALFHTLISTTILLLYNYILTNHLPVTILLFPIILLPLLLILLGISLFVSSFGVYFRDLSQTVGLITSALLFLSPIFYPITAIPETYRHFLFLNPLTFIIVEARSVLLWGQTPNWAGLFIYFSVSLLVLFLGWHWFQRTRKGFADVL